MERSEWRCERAHKEKLPTSWHSNREQKQIIQLQHTPRKGEKSMMKCESCGETFWEDEIRVRLIPEQYEIWGSHITHEYAEYRCPYCNSEEIREERSA